MDIFDNGICRAMTDAERFAFLRRPVSNRWCWCRLYRSEIVGGKIVWVRK